MSELHPVQAYDRSLRGPYYFGQRSHDRCEVFCCEGEPDYGLSPLDLAGSLSIRNHSPAGWEWGYGGSGPAQLALAILFHATGSQSQAERYYQRFKGAYVCHFPSDSWQLAKATVSRWLNRVIALEQSERGD